jgi:hypothetical protein
MIIDRTNPVGVDKWVSTLLTTMENNLLTTWGVLTATCEFYGRADKIDDKYWFNYNGINIDLGANTSLNFKSYIECESDTRYANALKITSAHLVCFANLKALYPLITDHRADGELRNHIENLLIQNLELSYYNGYTILDSTQENMQPYHSVKFNFDIYDYE